MIIAFNQLLDGVQYSSIDDVNEAILTLHARVTKYISTYGTSGIILDSLWALVESLCFIHVLKIAYIVYIAYIGQFILN